MALSTLRQTPFEMRKIGESHYHCIMVNDDQAGLLGVNPGVYFDLLSLPWIVMHTNKRKPRSGALLRPLKRLPDAEQKLNLVHTTVKQVWFYNINVFFASI